LFPFYAKRSKSLPPYAAASGINLCKLHTTAAQFAFAAHWATITPITTRRRCMNDMGDEFMQSQGGNNNPFNQDNETSWLDWQRLKHNEEVFRFFKKMISLRKSHALLGSSTFWREKVQWYGAGHPEVDMSAESQTLAYHLHDPSPATRDLYVMINGATIPQLFSIHAEPEMTWNRVVDTSLPSPTDLLSPDAEIPLQQNKYRVNQRSVIVLAQPRG
tara:strand:+ start:601 stop:1251 length:651 start_codon:yes stop_codon:yes gene_type:complete